MIMEADKQALNGSKLARRHVSAGVWASDAPGDVTLVETSAGAAEAPITTAAAAARARVKRMVYIATLYTKQCQPVSQVSINVLQNESRQTSLNTIDNCSSN